MRMIKRAVHIDFHTMPGIYDFNREWDASLFAQTLKDAHIDYVNAFARCNIGFAYYPTKVGVTYPGMKGDMFGDLLSECHKRDIGVSAYLSVGLDHEHAVRDIGWLKLDEEGRVIRGDRTANFFRILCFSNPDFLAYNYAMIKEVEAYHPDGFFFDNMVTEPCYCCHCLDGMAKAGLNPYDYASNMEYQERKLVDFSREAAQIAGPDKRLIMNGMHYIVKQDFDTHIEIECLPSGWGYDYFWPYVSYARKIKKEVIYMTGRFQINWGDFGGFKTKESLENDYFDALCAGIAGVSIGDHMHPAKNLEPAVYKTVRELNEMMMQYEPYTEGAEFVSEIGVLVNTKRNMTDKEIDYILSEGCKGLASMLLELKYTFDIVNEDMDFGGYRLLILPDSLRMSDALSDKLNTYLANGGRILSSGTAGLSADQSRFALKGYEDFSLDGIDSSNKSYFHIIDNYDPNISEMDYSMYSESGVLSTGGRKLADYVKAYFDRCWDGHHGYFYTPPEKSVGYCAASVSNAADVCHISFSIFKAYYRGAAYAHKSLVKKCIDLLMPDPILRVEGVPSTARVTLTRKDEYTLLHVKVTYPEPRGKMNIIEEHNILKSGAGVYVRGRFSSACTLPEREPVDITGEGLYTRVRLPEIVGYKLILINH